jgi:hypothetical protein
MTMLARIQNKINEHGEAFLINGTTPAKGFFRDLSSSLMHTYLDDTESLSVTYPGLFLVTLPDTPIAVDSRIVRDGRTYEVRKVAIERFAGTAMVKVAVLG